MSHWNLLLAFCVLSCCSFASSWIQSCSPNAASPSLLKHGKGNGFLLRKSEQVRPLTATLTIEETGKVPVRGFNAWYKLVKPSAADDTEEAPVVVLHGGPGVPHDYLCPLEQLAEAHKRPVFFFDQLGCGNSDEPQDEDFYSPLQCGEDVVTMLEHFATHHNLTAKGGFHVFGQSWGGCLAVEVVLNQWSKSKLLEENLKSVVLASTPSSPELAMESARSLIDKYMQESKTKTPEELNMRDDWPREKQFIEQWRLQSAAQCANEKFQLKHNLRLNHDPDCLKLAYTKLATVWRGANEVSEWAVSAAQLSTQWPKNVPVTMLRGEFDFVDKKCVQAFLDGLPDMDYLEMRGLSHMAHLEDTQAFVAALEAALSAADKDSRP